MTSALRCRCGVIQGDVDSRQVYIRAVCYCKDCQAYARFLGSQDDVLNERGGTEVVALLPSSVQFTAGSEKLACMSLTDKGILRWYASCCQTPLGNTPRDRRIAYVGLVRTCLPDLDGSFGSVRIAISTGSARGAVAATPIATGLGIVRIIRKVAWARLSGKYRKNPFFEADSGAPIRVPRVLAAAERSALEIDRA